MSITWYLRFLLLFVFFLLLNFEECFIGVTDVGAHATDNTLSEGEPNIVMIDLCFDVSVFLL